MHNTLSHNKISFHVNRKYTSMSAKLDATKINLLVCGKYQWRVWLVASDPPVCNTAVACRRHATCVKFWRARVLSMPPVCKHREIICHCWLAGNSKMQIKIDSMATCTYWVVVQQHKVADGLRSITENPASTCTELLHINTGVQQRFQGLYTATTVQDSKCISWDPLTDISIKRFVWKKNSIKHIAMESDGPI
jgi:hypothetical protein